MKLYACGVKILGGESKKTGEDFQMSMIFGLVPVEDFSKGKFSSRGYGFEPVEVQLDPDCIDQFKDIKFPSVIELDTDVTVRFGKYETVIVGVKGSKSVVRAA